MLFRAGKVIDFNPARDFMPVSRQIRPEIFVHSDGSVDVRGIEVILDYENIEAVEKVKDKAERQRLEGEIKIAKMLENAVNERYSMMRKVIKLVMNKQKDFILGDSDVIKSLRMKDVAKEIVNKKNNKAVVPATISKIVSEKYVQLPWGDLIPLGDLFDDSGVKTSSGYRSEGEIKQRIRELIDAEDKNRPYRDLDICRMLKAEGIPIKIKTANKYRNDLGIEDSKEREKK